MIVSQCDRGLHFYRHVSGVYTGTLLALYMTMDDRLYQFHKSQGWVLEPYYSDRRIQGVTDDGVKIWIIDRKPAPGERYLAREWDEYTYLGSYEEANLMEWKDYIADSVSLHECKRRTSNRYDQDYTFVTILQIED